MNLCEYPPDSFFFKSLPFFSQRCNVVTKGSPFNHFHDDVEMASFLETFVIMNYIWVVQLLQSREGGGYAQSKECQCNVNWYHLFFNDIDFIHDLPNTRFPIMASFSQQRSSALDLMETEGSTAAGILGSC